MKTKIEKAEEMFKAGYKIDFVAGVIGLSRFYLRMKYIESPTGIVTKRRTNI